MENDSPPHLSPNLQVKMPKRKSRSEMGLLNTLQGRMIPAAEKYLTTESWRYRMGLAYGNTMAAGCKSAAMLADLDDEVNVCPARVFCEFVRI